MSTAAATAPRGGRGFPLTGDARTRLQLLTSRPAQATARIPFLVSCIALLVVGLMTLLGFNIALSRGSYDVFRLQKEQARLRESEQQLSEQIEVASSPAAVSQKARALGMIPSTVPAFIRLADGKVIGAPTPATSADLPAFANLPTAGEPDAKTASRRAAEAATAYALHRAMERANIGTTSTVGARPTASPQRGATPVAPAQPVVPATPSSNQPGDGALPAPAGQKVPAQASSDPSTGTGG